MNYATVQPSDIVAGAIEKKKARLLSIKTGLKFKVNIRTIENIPSKFIFDKSHELFTKLFAIPRLLFWCFSFFVVTSHYSKHKYTSKPK
jgi:hypothetical protein